MGKIGTNQYKKVTLEDAKQDFMNNGYIPLFSEYENAHGKLFAKTKEGYKFYTTLQRVRANKAPGIFYKSNPYTMENIKLWLKLNNINYELLSREYQGSDKKLKLYCCTHGEFEKTWDNLKQGQGCPRCGINERNEDKKTSLEIVKQEFVSRGYTPLFDNYENNVQKLTAQTAEGYKIFTSLVELKVENIPSIFSMYNPYTVENIELWLKLNELPYKLLSSEFINAGEDKLKWYCSKHGEFYLTWHKLSSRGCPLCGNERGHGDGGYNITRAKQYKEKWVKIRTRVYIIECWGYNERFYKIGVTRNNIHERFSGQNMPYNYKAIKMINTNLYDAIYLEDKLHKLHEKYSYTPKIEFSGYTECFTQLNMKYIKELAS